MHQKLTLKQPALINRKGPIHLHDNIRPHVSMITRQKMYALNYEVLDHRPYLSQFSPTDFHFFKCLNNFLQEKCFRNPKYAETALNELVAIITTTFYDTGIKKKICFSFAKVY